MHVHEYCKFGLFRGGRVVFSVVTSAGFGCRTFCVLFSKTEVWEP